MEETQCCWKVTQDQQCNTNNIFATHSVAFVPVPVGIDIDIGVSVSKWDQDCVTQEHPGIK